ncbi:MAG TPA: polysaccharide biosynthesis/export family protein [Blastocatellia bacterium]|nr:polysaccharide biosynthesis/export family protein [Blastocatellia bacterium]
MKNAINYCFRFALPVLLAGLLASAVPAQEAEKKPEPEKKPKATERFSPDETVTGAAQKDSKVLTDADRQIGRRELESEAEAAVQPYLNNFFKDFRFGPQDVISVDVFKEDKYSRQGIVIPPHGKINYPLIGEVVVVGRTTTEVEKEITEKLSEYLIEPKVTVQIVQAHSLKYMVLGDVGRAGIYEMTRRLTVLEAIAEAGDITRYGDRGKVAVLRMQGDSTQKYPVNLNEIQRGRGAPFYLAPGDVIVVPGNKFKTVEKVMGMLTLGSWMRTIATGR